MPKSVIITCAVTGGIHTPSMSKYLPVTPEQIARESVAAAEAGASIIHLHARDPQTGQPTPDPKVFMQFLPQIKNNCDAIINLSTGGGLGMSLEQRLEAALITQPEMASLNCGSLNFGIFPMADKYQGMDWQHPWEEPFLQRTRDLVFKNTFADIETTLQSLGQAHNTQFEFECYDLGHLYNVAYFVDRGLIKKPFIQMIYGILGGVGADIANMTHMHQMALKLFGSDFEWSVLGAGRNQMPFATQSAMMGGNVRVGLEDSLYIGAGELAVSNADQVAKIRRIIEELGLKVATPADARERLNLKGVEQVAF